MCTQSSIHLPTHRWVVLWPIVVVLEETVDNVQLASVGILDDTRESHRIYHIIVLTIHCHRELFVACNAVFHHENLATYPEYAIFEGNGVLIVTLFHSSRLDFPLALRGLHDSFIKQLSCDIARRCSQITAIFCWDLRTRPPPLQQYWCHVTMIL